MKWLQWATIDLVHGLGGVEVHARSLARELTKLGVDHHFSQDPKVLLDPTWDVIHTHGSALPIGTKLAKRAIHAHAIHGESWGRMKACHEFLWLGGYHAAAREWAAVSRAKIVLADHENLDLYAWAQRLGKCVVAISNGWDPFEESSPELPPSLQVRLAETPYFVFLGRGQDPVKGAATLKDALLLAPGVQLVAVPGAGFEDTADVVKSGKLSSAQVKTILLGAAGLVLPSYYEGLPLAVLEALGHGVRVIACDVGGLKTLSDRLEGLFRIRSRNPEILAHKMNALRQDLQSGNPVHQQRRAEKNRKLLPSWAEVARRAYDTIKNSGLY